MRHSLPVAPGIFTAANRKQKEGRRQQRLCRHSCICPTTASPAFPPPPFFFAYFVPLQFCFYLLHWAACGFWYVALQQGGGANSRTWVAMEAEMLGESSPLEL